MTRVYTPGENGLHQSLPQDTMPTRVQAPSFWQTRGPPESPCMRRKDLFTSLKRGAGAPVCALTCPRAGSVQTNDKCGGRDRAGGSPIWATWQAQLCRLLLVGLGHVADTLPRLAGVGAPSTTAARRGGADAAERSSRLARAGAGRGRGRGRRGGAGPGLTMQDETPLAPAQIITSVILLPQNFLQSALDRRGRAACCSLSGVLLAGGTQGAGAGGGSGGQEPSPSRPTPGWRRPCLPPACSQSFPITMTSETELPTFPQT